jgi:hypothetical protein
MCCFCGGGTPAEEIDHFPSRAIFDDRQWPEGFVFPACSSCNRISRHPESIISFLSRLHTHKEDENHKKSIERCLKSIARNYSGLLEEMKPSTRQARKAVRHYNLDKPENTLYSDLPLLSFGSPRIDEAITIFGVKLILALYYKHLGRILPETGGIALKWYTNLQVVDGEIPEEVENSLLGYSLIRRCNTNLEDQFFYKFGKTEEHSAVFVTVFRMSFAIVGIVKNNAEELKIVEGITVHNPLKHDTASTESH